MPRATTTTDDLAALTLDPRMRAHAGSTVAVRCGKCDRRLETWGPDLGFLGALELPSTAGVTVSYEPDPTKEAQQRRGGDRIVYRCHPKRCGRVYPLRGGTIFDLLLKALEAGRTEVWL